MASTETLHQLELVHVDFFGRTRELEVLETSLDEIVDRNGDGGSRLVAVTGDAGTGKTRLVQTFHHRRVKNRAYFCQGKCELNRLNEPFWVLQDAIRDLYRNMLQDHEDNPVTYAIEDEIRTALGDELPILTTVVPELSHLMGETRFLPIQDEPRAAHHERINILFRVLFSSITRHVPLILFCDDLQWADDASLEVIRRLAIDVHLHRFLLVLAFRKPHPNHPVSKKLDVIQKKLEEPIRIVTLKNLSSPDTNNLIARILKLDPEETRELANVVFEKTSGNVFFLLQYLQQLQSEDLLTYSFVDIRWQWVDTRRIQNVTSVSENVVDQVVAKVKQSSMEVQCCLLLASFLGMSFNIRILRRLLNDFESTTCNIEDRLEEALRQGFLLRKSHQYRFAHDRIRQAAYSLIPVGWTRERLHYKIGQSLLRMRDSVSKEDAEWLEFAVPTQLQQAPSCLRKEAERVQLASCHLEAGQKATSMAAIVPAVQHLSNGIKIMDSIPDSWDRHYELQLSLRHSLAEVTCSTVSPLRSEKLVHEIVSHAKSKHKNLCACLTLAQSLGSQARQHEKAGVVKVRGLKSLGVFPRAFRTIKALALMKSVKSALNRRSVADVTNLPVCEDSSIIPAMKALRLLASHATFVGDDILQIFSGCLTAELVLKHGIHPVAIYCFAQVGALVTGLFGDASEGLRLGEMTMGLMERTGNTDTLASVIVWDSVQPWSVPLSNTLQPLLESYNAGMQQGHVDNALACFTVYLNHAFLAGLSLAPLLDDARSHTEAIQEYYCDYDNGVVSGPAVCVWQCMLNLAGQQPVNHANPTVMTGDAITREQDFLSMLHTHQSSCNNHGKLSFYLHKTILCCFFGDYWLADEMLRLAKTYSKSSSSSSSSSSRSGAGAGAATALASFYEVSQLQYYDALIAVVLASETSLSSYKRRACFAIRTMQRAVRKENKGINISHKLSLLEACFQAIQLSDNNINNNNNVVVIVEQAFARAIKMASKSGFRQDAAMANLRAGLFFLSRNDTRRTTSYLSRAMQLFRDWGADGVADYWTARHRKYILPLSCLDEGAEDEGDEIVRSSTGIIVAGQEPNLKFPRYYGTRSYGAFRRLHHRTNSGPVSN